MQVDGFCRWCGIDREVVLLHITQQDYIDLECLTCGNCDGEMREDQRIPYKLPEVYDPMAPLPVKKLGVNCAEGVRTPAQQERHYAGIIDQARLDIARERRAHGDVNMSGSESCLGKARIPRELFSSRMRDYGKNYWADEGEKALKRDGLLL